MIAYVRTSILIAIVSFVAGIGVTLGIQTMVQPRTYSGCILRYVKAGMSAEAVSATKRACELKHGAPTNNGR